MRSTLIQEEWRPIKNYEIYQASNFGRIRSLKDGKVKILKPIKSKNDYLRVCLCKNGIVKTFYVHRLVWEAFNGKIPEGMEINHINEDKTDNRYPENLNLMTHKENMRYRTGIKRRAEKHSKVVLQLTYPEGKFIKEWPSMAEAERNGFNQGGIWRCCHGKCKQYKGFMWGYKETYSL